MTDSLHEEAFTEDVLSDTLVIRQHTRGYRFGLDAVLLATDLPPAQLNKGPIIELGAAHGPVALSVASRLEHAHVIAIELQASLFHLLQHNASQHDFGTSHVECIHGDIRDVRALGVSTPASLVLFNPPYFPVHARRISPNPERASARSEVEGTFEEFLRAAQALLTPKGWCKCVLPPWRMASMWRAIHGTDFGCESLRMVHAKPQKDAYLMEVVLRRASAAETIVRAPLYIQQADGYDSEEVRARLHAVARPPHVSSQEPAV